MTRTPRHSEDKDDERSIVGGTLRRPDRSRGPCCGDLLALNTCSPSGSRSPSEAFISTEAEDVNVSV